MEIEERIISEISKNLSAEKDTDKKLLEEINKLIVYQSVSVTEKEKVERDAVNFIENKLYDLVKK